MIDDFDLIVSSFASEYGIRIYSDDFKKMKWDEFCSLISGLSPESPLGRIVQIRSENDKKVLKHFTKNQHKIRNEWHSRRFKKAPKKTEHERDEVLKYIADGFRNMAKGGNKCLTNQ